MTAIPGTFVLSTLALDALAQELIAAEPRLSPTVPPLNRAAPAPGTKKSVLITGGAGFLGVHMLQDIVASGQFGQVFLLVRRPDALAPAFRRYAINPRVLAGVVLIQGDLRDIPESQLPDVDYVIHSAARIHGLKSLRQLWADNVAATARLFAHYRGRANIVLVSTLSVFVSSNRQGVHRPEWIQPDTSTLLYGGYAQSKYVCERLAQAVGAKVVRLGLLTGSSYLGRFPENDFFSVFLARMRQLGCAPAGCSQAWVDVTPVDLAAHRIIGPLAADSLTDISHIANVAPVSVEAIRAKLGLAVVPQEQFREQLAALPGIERVLLTYAFFKDEAVLAMPGYFNIDLFQSTGHSYSIEKPFPVNNDRLLTLYLSESDSRSESSQF